MKKSILILSVLFIVLCPLLVSARNVDATEKVDMKGASEAVFRCDFSVGEFNIKPADLSEFAIADISYNDRKVEYFVESEIRRDRCYVDMETEYLRKHDMDSDDNIWDIQLSTRYPMTIDMEIGACEADFDLGGIPIKELSLEVGAASGVIEFSKENPERMEELSIDAGASSIEMYNIGNANFDQFSFDGGAGSFELDFRGTYKGESIIEISVGLGSADIILPKDIPVQVDKGGDNWMSSVDLHRRSLDEVDDDLYESDDFENADTRIVLILDVGMGSIDVYWK